MLLTFCFLFRTSSVFSQEWKEQKGDHFIVYYTREEALAKEIIRKAEIYYNRIAEDLGYPRYSNFWEWDNRCKVYVHPDKQVFQKATGQPDWSHGMASYLNKTIHTIEGTPDFTDRVLPHEITHLIFRDFVGMAGSIPLWIDEGVAQWEEEGKRESVRSQLRRYVVRGDVFSLTKLSLTDIRRSSDADTVALFYMQAISVVDYIVSRYGAASFTAFCRDLRDGKTLEDSARSAFSASIKDLDALESDWRQYVLKTYPRQDKGEKDE